MKDRPYQDTTWGEVIFCTFVALGAIYNLNHMFTPVPYKGESALEEKVKKEVPQKTQAPLAAPLVSNGNYTSKGQEYLAKAYVGPFSINLVK